MINRLRDYGDAIDRASHTCFECEQARKYVVMAECDLEAASQEREGTKALMEAVVRRENRVRAAHDVYAIRLAQVAKREEAVEFKGRVYSALAVLVAALELWLHWG